MILANLFHQSEYYSPPKCFIGVRHFKQKNLSTTEQTICNLLVEPIDLATSTTEQIENYLLFLSNDLVDMVYFNQNHLPVEAPQIDREAQINLLSKINTAHRESIAELKAQLV